jgi:hypothetical protein
MRAFLLFVLLVLTPVHHAQMLKSIVNAKAPAAPGGSLAVNSQMPTQTAQYGASQASPFTLSFTNTSGTVLYLAVMVGDVGSTVTAPTYGGVSMTLLGTASAANGTSALLRIYRLTSPATGTNNFSMTFTNAPTTVTAAAISFTGNNATPDSGTATAANDGNDFTHSAFPTTLTGTTSGNIGIQAACFGDPSYASVSGTLSANTSAHPDGGAFCNNFSFQYAPVTTTSLVLTTNGTSGTSWATVGIEVKH